MNKAGHDSLTKLFVRFRLESGDSVSKGFIESKSNNLREWYRKGQAAFRSTMGQDQVDTLNGFIQELEGDKREGFLMGWQSDAYACQNNLTLSYEGTHRQEVDSSVSTW